MNLPHPDHGDAMLEEHFGIGATIEHRDMTALEWKDYARALEADNKRLVALGNKLNGKLLDAQAARSKLNTAAETKAARLEGEAANWKVATYALGALWYVMIIWLVMGLSR